MSKQRIGCAFKVSWVAVICISCLLTFFVSLNSFADDKDEHGFYVPTNDEVIYGTWVNTTYTGSNHQKYVLYHWGFWEGYFKATDTTFFNRNLYSS
jgi:hypothetical protein